METPKEISDKITHANFKKIYNNYWKSLYLYAYNILKDKSICEDIIQDVFVSLWTRKESLNIENCSAYLHKAVKYQVLKHIRKEKNHQKYLEKIELSSNKNFTEEEILVEELQSLIDSKINILPNRCREIFALSRNEGYNHNEIAQHFDISTQTVKNQISKALSILRKGILTLIIFGQIIKIFL